MLTTGYPAFFSFRSEETNINQAKYILKCQFYPRNLPTNEIIWKCLFYNRLCYQDTNKHSTARRFFLCLSSQGSIFETLLLLPPFFAPGRIKPF